MFHQLEDNNYYKFGVFWQVEDFWLHSITRQILKENEKRESTENKVKNMTDYKRKETQRNSYTMRVCN